MPEQTVLRWLDGRGWLVLAGTVGNAPDETKSAIRGRAVARSSADGGVAVIALSGAEGAGDRLLDDLEDLGAPSGYIVDLNSDSDDQIHAKLAEAGVIVIESGMRADLVRSALRGAAIDAIQVAYENGAVVLAEGFSAMAFGTWLLSPAGEVAGGLEWVEGVLVLPILQPEHTAAVAKPVFDQEPGAVAVGVGVGSALALGPDGQIETWGQRQIVVALGPQYST